MNTPLVRKVVAGAAVACAVLLIAVLLTPRASEPIANGSPSPSPSPSSDVSPSPSPEASVSASPSPTAPPVEKYRLTVEVAGAGNGNVISIPAGIDCPTKCSALFPKGVKVVLEPRAGEVPTGYGPGYETAMEWSAPCVGAGTTCEATMTSNQTFRAVFSVRQSTFAIQVTIAGVGGIVTSSPSGIDCGATCLARFDAGEVILTAVAAEGYIFVAWTGGGCSGTGTCSIVVGADPNAPPAEVTATFVQLTPS